MTPLPSGARWWARRSLAARFDDWLIRPQPGWKQLVFCVSVCAASLSARVALDRWLHGSLPFALLAPMVTTCALRAGWPGGGFAILCGLLYSLALPPGFSRPSGADTFHVAELLFAVSGALIVFVSDHCRRSLVELERRRSELRDASRSQLEHALRAANLDHLSASLAHEINQPLTAVRSFAQAGSRWLDRERPEVAEALAAFRRVIELTDQAGALVRRIGEAVASSPAEFSSLDIADVVAEAFTLVEGQAHAGERSAVSQANRALAALAVGAFGIGVTEFAPMGLLPQVAAGLGVSLPRAGVLVSAYALGVMAGAPTVTLLLARMRQRSALVALMLVFVVGNGTAAVAPGFGALLAARVLTSLSHGAFFGIGSVLAASLVSKERRASAVATMFMGLTVANVGGVPAATWLGQAVGWRATFAAIAGLGALAVLALRSALSEGDACGAPDVRRELRALTAPAMLVALATTVAGAGAMFTTYTYVASMVRGIGRGGDSLVTWSLAAIGIGFTAGNWLGGRFADRAPARTLSIFLVSLAALSAALPVALDRPVSGVVALAA